MLFELNQTRTDQADHQCVHHWFENQVKRRPHEAALICGEQRLTYTELNARANRLAHFLRRKGIAPDTCVALCVERSAEALVGLLGILKAGGAYVPLNPTDPKARLAHQLAEIRAAVLLTQQTVLDALPEFAGEVIHLDGDQIAGESEEDPPPVATLENLVYVLYTSGSTGTPKGVAVTHRNLSNYTRFICDKLGLAQKRYAFATVSTLSADAGNTSIFPSLVSGGCLHVVSYEVATDARLFADYVSQHPIDVLKIVVSHLKTLLDSDAAILPREYLIFGGESSSWRLLDRIAEQQGKCFVLNHYGPTETTVGSLTFDLGEERSPTATVPIGRPIANTEVYVLDSHLNPVPVGVAGELHIGGAGVARGYLNRPELTAEKFIPNPFSEDPSARLYKTGDLVRYLPDGVIEFLGRLDHQVKIRGFRIELGEIETALGEHPQVRQNAVIARELENGDKRLIAYVIARGQPAPSAKELRGFLKDKLPEHMLPASFVTLASLPLNRNGKLDRNALPDPDHARPETDKAFAAPRTQVEAELARIWAKVLGIARVGIRDNFFELGGDS
ncbi:MAG: non-ribosomal peptide synthetase, partial [Burkholderiales bacterium]